MSTLLSGSIQPPLLGLYNSSSHPLPLLWTPYTDPSDPSSSFITLLADTSHRPNRRKWDTGPDERVFIPKRHGDKGTIVGNVLHVQGKTARRTFIQLGASSAAARAEQERGKGRSEDKGRSKAMGPLQEPLPLGVELPYIHLQLKRLGHRGLAFEVGVVDQRGREGVIRCSTSQKDPTIHRDRSPPLLHLPLALPRDHDHNQSLTPWMDVAINLTQQITLFQSLPDSDPALSDAESDHDQGQHPSKRPRTTHRDEMPNSQFNYISYIRVYANCRLKRVWASAEGEKSLEGMGSSAQREFSLHAANPI